MRVKTIVLEAVLLSTFLLLSCQKDRPTGSEGTTPPKTRMVCSAGCDFPSIQTAIEAAKDGDTIEIASGSHTVNGVITKSLEIRGTGDVQTDVVLEGGQRGYPVLRVEGKEKIRVVMGNLTLKGARGGATECASMSPKIICPDGLAIQGKAEVVLRHLTIRENGRMGVYVADYGQVSIYDSHISKNGRIGLFVRDHAKGTVERTVIENNNEGVMVGGWVTLSMSETKVIHNKSYGFFAGDQPRSTLSQCAIRGNGQNGIVLAGQAQISLIATEVSSNKSWGIAKMMSGPVPFSGTIEIDEESTLDGNEMGKIGSM